jgi:hypothetical protein
MGLFIILSSLCRDLGIKDAEARVVVPSDSIRIELCASDEKWRRERLER